MKVYEVTDTGVVYGVKVNLDPYPHVAVGEEGRGRVLTRVPLGRRFFESLGEEARVTQASIIRTKKGTLLIVEERPGDNRALALLRLPAGYRGEGWYTPLEDGVTVLARGRVAQGLAGRMGGHEELLVIMQPGARIRFQRTGRLYGRPSSYIISWNGHTLKCVPAEVQDVLDVLNDNDEGGELL